MYSNIKVYQKYLATSIKVGCATRSLKENKEHSIKNKLNTTNDIMEQYYGRTLIVCKMFIGHKANYDDYSIYINTQKCVLNDVPTLITSVSKHIYLDYNHYCYATQCHSARNSLSLTDAVIWRENQSFFGQHTNRLCLSIIMHILVGILLILLFELWKL